MPDPSVTLIDYQAFRYENALASCFNSCMGEESTDAYVRALVALCKREGGHQTVADVADVSAQNLWQIINGTKLPSGQPRGVGPTLRRKLSSAYPDWLLTNPPFGDDRAGQTRPISAAPVPIDRGSTGPMYYTPSALLRQLTSLCGPLDPNVRNAVAQLVAGAISDPQGLESAAAAIDALVAVRAKPTGTEA